MAATDTIILTDIAENNSIFRFPQFATVIPWSAFNSEPGGATGFHFEKWTGDNPNDNIFGEMWTQYNSSNAQLTPTSGIEWTAWVSAALTPGIVPTGVEGWNGNAYDWSIHGEFYCLRFDSSGIVTWEVQYYTVTNANVVSSLATDSGTTDLYSAASTDAVTTRFDVTPVEWSPNIAYFIVRIRLRNNTKNGSSSAYNFTAQQAGVFLSLQRIEATPV